jgi:uncharacterized Rmd1/YagE family protein
MENHTLKLYNEFKGIFDENVTEYDVENYYDLKEFVEFLKNLKEDINEAEYQGREVKLNKPMQGDVKKFKVYVKNEKGNVVKVNLDMVEHPLKVGEETMRKEGTQKEENHLEQDTIVIHQVQDQEQDIGVVKMVIIKVIK